MNKFHAIILASLLAFSMFFSGNAACAPTETGVIPPATAGDNNQQEAGLVQKESQLKRADLPPAIEQLVEGPLEKAIVERVDTGGRPEVLVAPERAGFKRYYQEGRGFKVNDFLSLSARVEIFEDFVPIDSLILAQEEQRIRGLNRLEFEDTLTDLEIRNSFIRAEAATAILKLNDQFPVLRFTYDYRQEYRVFDELLNAFKELRKTTYENFIEYRMPFKLPILGVWTLNAGYSRIHLRSHDNFNANDNRNKWTFNNAFQIDKERELFFAYEYFVGKQMDAPFILKPDQHFFQTQWRRRFADLRLFSVTNYSATRELFSPDVALYQKHEIFEELNKDFTARLRGTWRTTFITSKVANSNFFPSKVWANAFSGRVKVSYEIFPSIDVSGIFQQSWGLTTAEYDNSLWQFETELFKPGLIRVSYGYFIQRYYNSDKTENGIQFKAFVFQ